MRKWFQLSLYKFFSFCFSIQDNIDLYFKIRKYKRLEKKYGGWRNIPEDEMPQFFEPTPVDQNNQLTIVLTFNEMAKAVNGELMLLDSGDIVRKWLRGDYDDIDEIAKVREFIHAPNLNKAIINHFIKCGDLKPHKLEYLLNTSEQFRLFYEGKSRYIFPPEVKEEQND